MDKFTRRKAVLKEMLRRDTERHYQEVQEAKAKGIALCGVQGFLPKNFSVL